MLEVLSYIALNALNTVQKTKAMSKMSKIHYMEKKVLESRDLGLFNHIIKSYVCRRMLKMSKVK